MNPTAMNPTPTDPFRLLRRALRANATFSTLCALVLWSAPERLAAAFGLTRARDLTDLAVMLLVFAAGLVALAARRAINRAGAWVAVGLDVGWVGLTAQLLATGWFAPVGKVVAVGVALVVGGCAWCQYRGLRRLAAAAR